MLEWSVMNKLIQTAKQQGFTLIELMITLVVVAILVGVAVPSFQSFIKRNQAESLQTQVASAVSTARTEAASRNTSVSICASNDGVSCGGSWTNGWIVFENPNRDTTKQADELTVATFDNTSSSTFDVAQGQNPLNKLIQLTFSQQGFLVGQTSVLITICNAQKETAYTRGLFVNASGLVVKTKDNNNDGVQDYYKSGVLTALACP